MHSPNARTSEQKVRLHEKDRELFFKLYPALLLYANQRLKVIEGATTPEKFEELSLEEQMEVRDALCDNPSLIDLFAAENLSRFTQEEFETVSGWRHHVRGTFYLVRYLKRYAVFLDESATRAYGVVALSDSFEEILGPELPVRLEAVLLPFKGRIVYDGFMRYSNIYFGGGFRRSLNEDYQEAKHRHGVITSLPAPEEKERSDEEMLRFYMRSKGSRVRYEGEIEGLVAKDSGLLRVYHHELGKVDAKWYRRRLRGLGLTRGWFAVFEGIIVAGGGSREEVERVLDGIVPSEKRELAYIFQLRMKKPKG